MKRAFLLGAALAWVALFIVGAASAQDGKVAPDVWPLLDKKGDVRLVLTLTNQPGPRVGRQVRERYEAQLEALSDRARAITRLQLPQKSLSPAQERRFRLAPLTPILEQTRTMYLADADAVRTRMADEIVATVRPLVEFEHAALGVFVARMGGRVTSSTTILSTLAATVPARQVLKLAGHPGIAWVDLDHAGAPELDVQAPSLGLTTGFWPNGFNGGVHDVGVLDTGVQQNHPAFVGHRFESNGGTTDSNGHGTGIAGILASRDATFRGMAWASDTISVAIAGADSTSMSGLNYLMTGTTERAENVNYSFGNGTANTTDYSSFDRFFDAVIDTFGVMVSKSTGNGGWGTTTITHPAPAYNLLASANMDDRNTVTRADDLITSSSSRGPTLGGRKKPDITAPGTNSMTTNRTGGFSNLGGTSSASPHTGGGAVLLFNLGLSDVRAIKAVLLNSADAWNDNNTSTTADDGPVNGSLWTKTFGWGYLDLAEAYINGLDAFVRDMPAPTGARRYKLFKGFMFASEKATLVWNRHVAYNGAAYPTQTEDLSNLDLQSWRASDNGLLKTSASLIDNVEQIDVPADGDVVLKVYTTGTFDPQVPTERFGLATEENFAETTGPAFGLSWGHPTSVAPGATFTVTVTVTNTGDVPAHGNTVTLGGGTVVGGANPQTLPSIPAGQSRVATWTVQAPATTGTINLTATQSSNSYGETFAASGNSSVQVTQPVVFPGSFSVGPGLLESGVLADLFNEDANRVVCKLDLSREELGPHIQVLVEGTAPTANPASMSVVLKASAQLTGVRQTIEMYDWVASQFVPVDSRTASLTDTTVTVAVPSPLARFVRAGDRRLRTRFGWESLAFDSSAAWRVWIDRAVWLMP